MIIEPQPKDEAGRSPLHVHSTSAWVHRCAKRMLELDPELDPVAAMHTVDDMARITRWRSMPPEAVAEAIYARAADEAPISFDIPSDVEHLSARRSGRRKWPSGREALQNRRRRPICRHDDHSHAALAAGRTCLCGRPPRSSRRRRSCAFRRDSIVAGGKHSGDESEAGGRPTTPRRQAAWRGSQGERSAEPDQRGLQPADLSSLRQALTSSAQARIARFVSDCGERAGLTGLNAIPRRSGCTRVDRCISFRHAVPRLQLCGPRNRGRQRRRVYELRSSALACARPDDRRGQRRSARRRLSAAACLGRGDASMAGGTCSLLV